MGPGLVEKAPKLSCNKPFVSEGCPGSLRSCVEVAVSRIINMCAIGLKSHYFHIRIPIKGGMTIPNIATFDHGTVQQPENRMNIMQSCFWCDVFFVVDAGVRLNYSFNVYSYSYLHVCI